MEARRCGQPRPGPSPAAGETELAGTGAGRGTSRRSGRTTPDCRWWWCWRPTSPGGGRRPAPRSSSSWWTGGPCPCCCGRTEDEREQSLTQHMNIIVSVRLCFKCLRMCVFSILSSGFCCSRTVLLWFWLYLTWRMWESSMVRCPRRRVCCWVVRPSLEMAQTRASITESSRRSSLFLLSSSSAVSGEFVHRSATRSTDTC